MGTALHKKLAKDPTLTAEEATHWALADDFELPWPILAREVPLSIPGPEYTIPLDPSVTLVGTPDAVAFDNHEYYSVQHKSTSLTPTTWPHLAEQVRRGLHECLYDDMITKHYGSCGGTHLYVWPIAATWKDQPKEPVWFPLVRTEADLREARRTIAWAVGQIAAEASATESLRHQPSCHYRTFKSLGDCPFYNVCWNGATYDTCGVVFQDTTDRYPVSRLLR
jgi:hypothetical protein